MVIVITPWGSCSIGISPTKEGLYCNGTDSYDFTG